jgi:putative hydrolase of HD superfamily
MDIKNITKKLQFLEEIEKFKKIERGNYFSDQTRGETDAEHTWHLAMFLLVFEDELPRGIDKIKLFKMALIHDLAEIYAGDEFFLTDKLAKKEKQKRELGAAKKLFSKLPDKQACEFLKLFKEYEERKTTEAQIVAAFDKIQAIHQNISSCWLTYKKHGFSIDKIKEYHKTPMEYNKLTTLIYELIFKEAKKRKYEK